MIFVISGKYISSLYRGRNNMSSRVDYYNHVFHEQLGNVGDLLKWSNVTKIGVNQVHVQSPLLPGPSGEIRLGVFAQDETAGKASLGGALAGYKAFRK